MDNIVLYVKESYNELLNHVTWPTWPELFTSTRLVIVGSIILSLIIALFDVISNNILQGIYNL